MKTDRFLAGILIGIGVLVVLALALFFLRREGVDYVAEDTPEGVLHNYALAVQRQDYERAYTYVAETETSPTFENFRMAFLLKQVDPGNAGLQIGETNISGDEAIVTVTIVRPTGPFADTYRDVQSALLVRQDGGWKIAQAPWPYWNWDWSVEPAKIR